jgi:outer membrane autotransporter protein
MKNPVQRRLRTFQWAAALGVFLTSNALQAESADSYLPATAFWLNLQGLSSPQVADRDSGGDFHTSLLTLRDPFVRSASDSTTFNDQHERSIDPAAIPGPATNWQNPSTGNWFVSRNWTNGLPNSSSSATVANGGTAVVEATPTPSPPPDSKAAKTRNRGSVRSNASVASTTAQVGSLTIGSLNGLGGTVLVGPGGILDVFQSLDVEANGTLKGLAGPAAFILNGGSATNLGVISGQTDGLIFVNGGTLLNAVGGSITAVTGTGVVLEAGNATITNLGTITGGGGIAIDTTSSAGNIALTNAGTINGNVVLGNGTNTVTLITGSNLKGNLNLGTNSGSGLVLDGSGQETLSEAITGTITDPGSLTKQGSGTWIIDENLSAPVSTNLIAGTLTLAATLTSPSVTIGNGGTLIGTGTISGNVTNSGIISPGNPFGTLTIRGNYTQTSNGLFRLELGGLTPGQFGLLNVTGNASLAGTLQIVRTGNVTLMPGDKLVFITAGSVTGSFSTVQNLDSIVNARVTLLPDAVEIVGVQGSFVSAACNPNSVSVAKALDSAVGDPRAAALINFLDSQPLSVLCPDFTLISPEELTAIFSLDVSLANIQTANLERRLEDIRAGSTGFSSSGFTINGSAPSFSQGLSGPTGADGKTGPSITAPIPENRWGFFATGLGEFTDVSTADGARGFNFRTGGVTLGVDYRIGNNFAIGLTGGYAHTGVDLSGDGSINVDGGSGGFYATAFGGGFYLDTSVTGGASDYETHRTALLGTANGSTDSDTVNVLIAGGYDWTKGALTIGPIASFQYTYVGLNGFTETGSLAPLRYGDQSVDSIRSALGIKASYDWKIGGVLIRPELRASWQHEYGDSTYSIVASFANGAGTNFTVNGPNIGRDSLLIGAGVAILWNDRISSYIYYDGELARTNYDSQSVSAGLRVTF